ncbi:hypothetical protein [Treponema pallidum]|uniref:hypothetical protein n=1 Tax=Treponema pallidum TaxID=160 RepID=UPI0007AFF589|nr:hypothetical protein A4W95_00245 [Treponema pallidum subsp. pallidum]
MSKKEKTDAIHFLSQIGAFLITRAEDRVSHYFGISKYTPTVISKLANRDRTGLSPQQRDRRALLLPWFKLLGEDNSSGADRSHHAPTRPEILGHHR